MNRRDAFSVGVLLLLLAGGLVQTNSTIAPAHPNAHSANDRKDESCHSRNDQYVSNMRSSSSLYTTHVVQLWPIAGGGARRIERAGAFPRVAWSIITSQGARLVVMLRLTGGRDVIALLCYICVVLVGIYPPFAVDKPTRGGISRNA